MSEATPRPWVLITDQDYCDKYEMLTDFWTGTGKSPKQLAQESEANVKLMMRAVNNYDALLEACKRARAQWMDPDENLDQAMDLCDQLDQAIANAEKP